MATITDLQSNDNGVDSRVIINDNINNLNNDKQENLAEGPFVDGDKTKLDGIEAGATADQTSEEVTYDNTESGLTATNVKDAVDELQENKVDIDIVAGNLTLYNTTAASVIGGYTRLVTSTTDPDYDSLAVDVPTGTITTTGQLISSQASDEGITIGNTGIISITTIGNIKRVSGSGTATFYFEAYKRDSGGTETLIGTSNQTAAVTSSDYVQFFTSTLISDTNFTATDRLVTKFYGERISGGSDPVYNFQIGGTTPVKTIFPIPFASVNHDALANVNEAGSGVTNGHITDLSQTIAGTKTFSDQIIADAGSEANPGLAIDTNAQGFYDSGVNRISLSLGGTQQYRWEQGAFYIMGPQPSLYFDETDESLDWRIDVSSDNMRFIRSAGVRMVIDDAGKIGIGTSSPNEIMTVEGVLSLDERSSAPTQTAGYGKLYVKSANGNLFFKDSSGTETQLNVGGVDVVPNLYVSSETITTANTVYTFTHNLGLTQTDVENGRYKVFISSGFNDGRLAGDNYFDTTFWGAGASNVLQDWSSGTPSNTGQVYHQANSLKIKWGTLANVRARLIIQQLY